VQHHDVAADREAKAENNAGRGATFHVTLPLEREACALAAHTSS
jgi:hypothetical protein